MSLLVNWGCKSLILLMFLACLNNSMINIDLDQLIEHLELNLPLSEDQRLFLITVCTVMYREDGLDHLSEPATKH